MINMTITSAKYQPNDTRDGNDTSVLKCIIDGVEMYVPTDPYNRHYAEVLRQVDAGELTIEDAD
tara:strand:- start:989 stop:1180 length:192 start_codon:yes stop_codon:yes gene_type:complete